LIEDLGDEPAAPLEEEDKEEEVKKPKKASMPSGFQSEQVDKIKEKLAA
jgi:hypothetical protein